MDFCGRMRMRTLKPTGTINRVTFECLLKVHGGKRFMDVLWGKQTQWDTGKLSSFRGTPALLAWCALASG